MHEGLMRPSIYLQRICICVAVAAIVRPPFAFEFLGESKRRVFLADC
jgi:hypothetical protein